MLFFTEDIHHYESIVPDNRTWRSVSSVISLFKGPFDEISISESVSKKLNSKWYGMEPEKIRQIWKAEKDRSINLGKWYHAKREKEEKNAIECPIVDGCKYALPQQLKDGVYTEFITYHPEFNICGTIDRLEVKKGTFMINDYKTNKTLVANSYGNKRMSYPANTFEDCNTEHYTLQLMLYAIMIMYHNPNLQLTKLVIEHVSFKSSGYDSYGFPNTDKEPKIDTVTPLILPFTQRMGTVKKIMEWVKNNPQAFGG